MGASQPEDDYKFFYGNGNADHHLGAGFFVHQGIRSAIKWAKFVSDRMSYITHRDRWWDIVLNAHAPTEDKSDNTKDNFYEELERVFNPFLKNRIKILLRNFNAEDEREDIFKPTIWNESLHEISNDNGVREVNFATQKDLSRVNCSKIATLHYTWTSDGKTHN
jgi:hypothetical protein